MLGLALFSRFVRQLRLCRVRANDCVNPEDALALGFESVRIVRDERRFVSLNHGRGESEINQNAERLNEISRIRHSFQDRSARARAQGPVWSNALKSAAHMRVVCY